jgi:hypothetical protein
VGATAALVADKPSGPSDTEGVRVGRGDGTRRESNADRLADGSLVEEVQGRPPRSKETELRVARMLVEKLNSEGGSWAAPRSLDEERSRTVAREDGVIV